MPSEWETALLCNDVSHWLGANLDSALFFYICVRCMYRKQIYPVHSHVCICTPQLCELLGKNYDIAWYAEIKTHVMFINRNCCSKIRKKVHAICYPQRSLKKYLCNWQNWWTGSFSKWLDVFLIPQAFNHATSMHACNWGVLYQKQVSSAGTNNFIPHILW